MASGRPIQAEAGDNALVQCHPREGGTTRHIVGRLGPLPISSHEIHIVLDALGPLLAELFEGEAG